MPSYIPQRPSLWSNPSAPSRYGSNWTDSIADSISPAQGGGLFSTRNLASVGGSLLENAVPFLKLPAMAYSAGTAASHGYQDQANGPHYQISDTGEVKPEKSPSLLSRLIRLPDTAGYYAGRAAASLFAPPNENTAAPTYIGPGMTTRPNFSGPSGNGYSGVYNPPGQAPAPQPAPSLFSQPIQSARPLAPRTSDIEQSARTAAVRSLEQAYGSKQSYDPMRGWVSSAPTPSAPEPAPSLFALGNDTGGGGGGWSPWYGDTNPYSATGNMNMQTTAYGGQWVNNPNYDPNWWMYGADGINHGNQPGS